MLPRIFSLCFLVEKIVAVACLLERTQHSEVIRTAGKTAGRGLIIPVFDFPVIFGSVKFKRRTGEIDIRTAVTLGAVGHRSTVAPGIPNLSAAAGIAVSNDFIFIGNITGVGIVVYRRKNRSRVSHANRICNS